LFGLDLITSGAKQGFQEHEPKFLRDYCENHVKDLPKKGQNKSEREGGGDEGTERDFGA